MHAGSLKKLGLPATESNARAMMRALGKAEDASIAYGEFRRFAILMPPDKLMNDTEASVTWFESATCVPLGGAPLCLMVSLRSPLCCLPCCAHDAAPPPQLYW